LEKKNVLPLAIALLLFPQLAQTLYSPALADLVRRFHVVPGDASQSLTIYFLAFAVGVVGWGWLSDRMGRRPALLGGLAVYSAASVLALCASSFQGLLLAQALAALGAAAGSVVTQTVLRDRYEGAALARAFSIAAMVLALSPTIGLSVGAALVDVFGYRGVLWSLLLLSLSLLSWATYCLPETCIPKAVRPSIPETLILMSRDRHVWRAALLVAVLNVGTFSYYALAPFMFDQMGVNQVLYGLSGVLLAAGSLLGTWSNRRLSHAGWQGNRLSMLGALLMLGSGIAVQLLQHSLWFVLPMTMVMFAFGLTIPHALGDALTTYRGRMGAAGAVFGLAYYLMIGAGMWIAGWTQALGGTLMVCGYVAVWLSWRLSDLPNFLSFRRKRGTSRS
jgi:predicted MFS family arabinose efflux permease